MGTSIKTKFRKSTVDGKAGTVFFQVIYNRQMARINTDIHLLPCDWEKVCDKTDNNSDYISVMRQRIDTNNSAVHLIVNCCKESGNDYSAKTIVTMFKANHANRPTFIDKPMECETNGNATSFLELIRNQASVLKAEKKHGTAANYTHTLNSLKAFANGKDLTLEMVNQEMMEKYEAWLRNKGLKRNTISFYMRILRAVYNIAVKDGLTQQSYPFSKVFTGTDKTPKRAVKENVIKEIANLDLKDNQALQKSRDIFLLSYSLCGMPFVDMAYLKPNNIKDGYLTYERHKTGEPISFKLSPQAEIVIRRYAKKDSTYVLPILTATDSDKVYKQYRTALVEYNRNLHTIGKMLKSNIHLTSYVARHSWATSARKHGYPASAIGKALGHTNEKTTQTYLDAIDNEVIDKMNKDVLGCLQNLLPSRK